MSRLKYVCISDLHLGAPNSVLTAATLLPPTNPAKSPEQILSPLPEETPPALARLGEALRAFIPDLAAGGPRPTLILLGDVLDLGFSPPHVVSMAMQRFIEQVFLPADQPLFAPKILLVPGNHDHTLWQEGKTVHFLAGLRAARGGPVPPLQETTRMMAEPTVLCRWLTDLFQSYGLRDHTVEMAYPNLGFINDARAVFLHHGHYLESLYRLVSDLGTFLDDGATHAKTGPDLEGANGKWIDFLWSGLSATGSGAYSMYSLMQDSAATHAFTNSIAARIQRTVLRHLPMGGLAEVQKLQLALTKGFFDVAIGKAGDVERTSYDSVLSPETIKELKSYLSDLVFPQFADEARKQADETGGTPRALPQDISFVFGHTHKPFEDLLSLDQVPQPVKVYNTGGWALDVPQMVATQGAAMVLIDDDLRVASLRLFNDPVNDIIEPVRANGVGGLPDRDNPFLAEVTSCTERHAEEWNRFSEAVRSGVNRRSNLIQAEFFPAAAAMGASA